jgi:SAM-dependent methyltransferase
MLKMFIEILHRIAAYPRIYELIQVAAGMMILRNLLQERLTFIAPDAQILDIGGGTGLYRTCLPPACKYTCLDIDPLKLAGFRSKYQRERAILADGTRLPIQTRTMDAVLCILVLHHIHDDAKIQLVDEAWRVLRDDGHLVVLDAVRAPDRLKSRVLWACDRGNYPGTDDSLRSLFPSRSRTMCWESHTIHHRYVLGIFTPTSRSSTESQSIEII